MWPRAEAFGARPVPFRVPTDQLVAMNVLYEEDGSFKVGTVLAETDAAMQIEAVSGKRVKVKRANVLLGFNEGGLADFLERANAAAEEIEVDFLWQVCGADEFGFADLAFGSRTGSRTGRRRTPGRR